MAKLETITVMGTDGRSTAFKGNLYSEDVVMSGDVPSLLLEGCTLEATIVDGKIVEVSVVRLLEDNPLNQ
jgi:hypothetical protein